MNKLFSLSVVLITFVAVLSGCASEAVQPPKAAGDGLTREDYRRIIQERADAAVSPPSEAKVEVEIAHISEDEANDILNGKDDGDDWRDHLPSSKHLPISYEAPAGWKSEGARSCDVDSIDTFVKDGNVIVLDVTNMKPDADAGYVNILVAAFKHDGCEGGYNDLKVDEGMILGTQVCGERVMSVVHFTFYGENYAIRGNVPRDQLSELTAATSAILASFKQSKEGIEAGSGFDESCY